MNRSPSWYFARAASSADGFFSLQTVLVQVAYDRLELGANLGRVPYACRRFLTLLRFTPDKDQPILQLVLLTIDHALQTIRGLERLVLITLLKRQLLLAFGAVRHRPQLVTMFQKALLQLRRKSTAAQEAAIVSCHSQQVLRRVQLGVGDVQQLLLGQHRPQPPQVVQMRRRFRRVAVQRQVSDRHAAVPGHVHTHLNLLDVLASALGAAIRRRGLGRRLALGPLQLISAVQLDAGDVVMHLRNIKLELLDGRNTAAICTESLCAAMRSSARPGGRR